MLDIDDTRLSFFVTSFFHSKSQGEKKQVCIYFLFLPTILHTSFIHSYLPYHIRQRIQFSFTLLPFTPSPCSTTPRKKVKKIIQRKQHKSKVNELPFVTSTQMPLHKRRRRFNALPLAHPYPASVRYLRQSPLLLLSTHPLKNKNVTPMLVQISLLQKISIHFPRQFRRLFPCHPLPS